MHGGSLPFFTPPACPVLSPSESIKADGALQQVMQDQTGTDRWACGVQGQGQASSPSAQARAPQSGPASLQHLFLGCKVGMLQVAEQELFASARALGTCLGRGGL